MNKLYLEKNGNRNYYFLQSNDFYGFGTTKGFGNYMDSVGKFHREDYKHQIKGQLVTLDGGSAISYFNGPVQIFHYLLSDDFKNLIYQTYTFKYPGKSGKFSDLFSIESNELDSLDIISIGLNFYYIVNDELYDLLPYAHNVLNKPNEDFERSRYKYVQKREDDDLGHVYTYKDSILILRQSSDLLNDN